MTTTETRRRLRDQLDALDFSTLRRLEAHAAAEQDADERILDALNVEIASRLAGKLAAGDRRVIR